MARLPPGTRVQVRNDWPESRGPAHIRTPHYVRGRTGTVVRALGTFRNPEDLAFARAAPPRNLYHVRFDQDALWPDGRESDHLLVEIFEQWLEPA
jgi:hypothetical protein